MKEKFEMKEVDSMNDKLKINQRHIKLFEKTLESVEMILDGFLYELRSYDDSFMNLSKSTVGILESLVSSLIKIQKGERLALGISDESVEEDFEPVINVIEGIDITKV